MKRLLSFFVALVATTCLWAQNNVITYTATEKLPGMTDPSLVGLGPEAFNVPIISHTFVDGVGTITFAGDVTTIGGLAFINCSAMSSITLPESVTSIGNSAFQYCNALASINIPNNVTSIGGSVFGYCFSLTSITIPQNVTSIDEYAFYGCDNLISVKMEGATPPSLLGGGPSGNGATLYVPRGSASAYAAAPYWNDQFVIEEYGGQNNVITYTATEKLPGMTDPSLVGLGPEAFNVPIISHTFVDGVGTITFAGDVTTIGHGAFINCSAMSSIVLPESVTSIGAHAFQYCNALASINIPNGVTSFGSSVFGYCNSLTSITLPNSVTSIDEYVFYGCENLTSVKMKSATPPALLGGGPCSNGATLYVPRGSASAYAAAPHWNEFNIEEYDYLDLADGDAYSESAATDYDEFTYTRTVWDNDWNLMYVPFAIDVEEMLDEHNMQLYMLNMFHCYDDNHDGTIDRTTIEVMKATEGKTLPNHPYLMKYTSELTAEELTNGKVVTINMEDVTLAATANYQNALKSMSYTYTIYGTYSAISAATATAGHYYSLGTDAEGHVMFGESTGGIRAQRWYYTITDNASQLTIDPASAPVRVVEMTEDATGMAEHKTSATLVGYYTLDGMRLSMPIPGAICVARYADGTSKKVLSN